ncbi:SNF5/SMARCB1/INI1-like protein [Artemisia annua]|uniref:SNF5/SMARCB1/INI1-like protein n=1 Tax=Artemisia annua TaxID=35608 RepID=A0A2U1P0E1_ARTAN|nr:SNF5/SMARCB1/INI1-like protein [Artemisia annua]
MKPHPGWGSLGNPTVKFRFPTAENLVPICLDIDIEGQRYRDTSLFSKDYAIDFDDDSHPVKPFHCRNESRLYRQTKHINRKRVRNINTFNLTCTKSLWNEFHNDADFYCPQILMAESDVSGWGEYSYRDDRDLPPSVPPELIISGKFLTLQDQDCDISEEVSLGMESAGGSHVGDSVGGEDIYDQRLFNHEKGIKSNFTTVISTMYMIKDSVLKK